MTPDRLLYNLAAAALYKEAKKLRAADRAQIAQSDFAIPSRADDAGEKKQSGNYPIHDRSHARAALSMVSRHGSDAEKAQVRAAVRRKYPGMGKEAFNVSSPSPGVSETAAPSRNAVPFKMPNPTTQTGPQSTPTAVTFKPTSQGQSGFDTKPKTQGNSGFKPPQTFQPFKPYKPPTPQIVNRFGGPR